MVNTKFDRKALSEVYEVLTMLENKDFVKIPKNLIEAINKNKDNEYEVDFQNLEDARMLPDTVNILSAIYMYYLASEDEKNIINKLIYEKTKKNNIAYPVFTTKTIQKEENLQQQSLIVTKKDNILMKILNKIRKYFWKK